MTNNKPSVTDSLIEKFDHYEIIQLAHAALVFKRHDVISIENAKLLWRGDFIRFGLIRDFMKEDFNGQYYSGAWFTKRGEKGTEELMAEMELPADVFEEIEDPFDREFVQDMRLDLSKGFTPKNDIGPLTSKGINADFVALLFLLKPYGLRRALLWGLG